MANKTLQEIETDLDQLRSQLEGLDRSLDSKIQQVARIAALETLDQRVTERLRTAFAVGGFVLALLGDSVFWASTLSFLQ